MDSEKPPSLRSLLTRALCTVVGLLLLYVLSVGPACYLAVKSGRGTWRTVDRLYGPLGRAVKGTPLNDPIAAYVEFWLRLAGEKPFMP